MRLIAFVVILILLAPTLGCELRDSKINYFDYPFTIRGDNRDYLCIHMASNQSIHTCKGGCEGYFYHEPVYTLGNENLDYIANRSCSGEHMHCCRAHTKSTIAVELIFICVDLTQFNITDDRFTDMVIAYFFYMYDLELFNQFYPTNLRILEIEGLQETATSCGCGVCYDPIRVSETICHYLSQPH